MPSFRSARVARHSPQQMFDLVADTDKYPEFLPFCASMKTRPRGQDAEGNAIVLAEMEIGYKAIRERFVTRNTLDRKALRITVEYVDGPFSRLRNIWQFVAVPEGCRVEFFIDYEFKSRLFAALMGTVFDTIFRTFASAFEARADKIYGKPPGVRA
ncbi:MAG TPA: type II toxin-antitoxin system RatA family toxin [Roseiarcus sp.]|nr:type II toxin-antitoxin system RatA family toxin [Roseiarcus sp.]